MAANVMPQRGGLRFAGFIGSPGLGTPPIVARPVASAYGTALFCGDALVTVNDGTVAAVAAGDANPITHVMVSAKNYLGPDSLPRKGQYLPASTSYTGTVSLDNPLASVVLCIPVDNMLFEVDITTAASTKTAAQSLVGQSVNIVATAGSTVNGMSGYTTDTVANFKTPGDTTHGQLILVRIPQYDLQGYINDPTKTYWKGIFRVNPALMQPQI